MQIRLRSYTCYLSPPLHEQRAIAAALSEVDDLISALDKLIAKKRVVKTAAMQQLLTGKQRLPGFSGEWEVKRLGDVARADRCVGLIYPSRSNADYWGGRITQLSDGQGWCELRSTYRARKTMYGCRPWSRQQVPIRYYRQLLVMFEADGY